MSCRPVTSTQADVARFIGAAKRAGADAVHRLPTERCKISSQKKNARSSLEGMPPCPARDRHTCFRK
jgi:hypothetical protein